MMKQNESAGEAATLVSDVPTLGKLFFTWVRIGATSFGGGAITQFLIQEYFIYRYRWLREEEYATIIAMSQVVPGINILAYTILIGHRLAGWGGIVVSLMGLILPSAAITIGISAVYVSVNEYPKIQAMLRTVFAAIFGISLATNWRNAKPILVRNYQRKRSVFLIMLAVMIASALLYIFVKPPVVFIYFFGGLIGAVTYWWAARKNGKVES